MSGQPAVPLPDGQSRPSGSASAPAQPASGDASGQRAAFAVIALLLVALVVMALVIVTQVHLDDEPYPCTPVERSVDT